MIVRVRLPEKPVDGFEFEWWTVDNYCDGEPTHMHARYVEDKSWSAMFPDDASWAGARFLDQWMMSYNGCFNGRLNGWSRLELVINTTEVSTPFETREQAVAYLKGMLASHVVVSRDSLLRAEARLAAFIYKESRS